MVVNNGSKYVKEEETMHSTTQINMSILPACFSVTFSSLLSSITLRLLLMGMWASEVARLINNPPAMWETWVQSLGWDDPLEKEMATHSSILAWRIPWTV